MLDALISHRHARWMQRPCKSSKRPNNYVLFLAPPSQLILNRVALRFNIHQTRRRPILAVDLIRFHYLFVFVVQALDVSLRYELLDASRSDNFNTFHLMREEITPCYFARIMVCLFGCRAGKG